MNNYQQMKLDRATALVKQIEEGSGLPIGTVVSDFFAANDNNRLSTGKVPDQSLRTFLTWSSDQKLIPYRDIWNADDDSLFEVLAEYGIFKVEIPRGVASHATGIVSGVILESEKHLRSLVDDSQRLNPGQLHFLDSLWKKHLGEGLNRDLPEVVTPESAWEAAFKEAMQRLVHANPNTAPDIVRVALAESGYGTDGLKRNDIRRKMLDYLK